MLAIWAAAVAAVVAAVVARVARVTAAAARALHCAKAEGTGVRCGCFEPDRPHASRFPSSRTASSRTAESFLM